MNVEINWLSKKMTTMFVVLANRNHKENTIQQGSRRNKRE